MKMIITVKIGKGNKSIEKKIDKTVDALEKILFISNRNLQNYKWSKCKVMCDGTQIVLERIKSS